jgi:3-methyl-2-oxobutanoate hydroxymethyltransferase
MSQTTTTTLMQKKQQGEKITMLTSYDASMTKVLERAGIDTILVGDSLGMVIQGQSSTLPVEIDEMIYHTRCVARGLGSALLIADMPFMSYNSPDQALHNAARLMKEGGAHMVKLEGGAMQLDTVHHLNDYSIPVCAHLGLTPQSVHKLGGYRVQGKDEESARVIREDAMALESAGAQILVLECVPSALAADISRVLTIPVIGIGAGVDCDGQVLVVYDMLGITSGHKPRFVKDFMVEAGSVEGAVAAYIEEVKAGRFPTLEHSFK